jgi:hypothetical protein
VNERGLTVNWEKLLFDLEYDLRMDRAGLNDGMPSPHFRGVFNSAVWQRVRQSRSHVREPGEAKRCGMARKWFKEALEAGLSEAQAVYVVMKFWQRE